MITPHEVRLWAIDHARVLLDQERSRLVHGEEEMLFALINPGCDDPDCSCHEDLVVDAGERERRLNARYRSAFNKLLFEVAECERTP